jgi:hypothetical protein
MKKILFLSILTISVVGAVGCHGGSSEAANDKALRQGFAKTHFDISEVPPEHRALVQGYIDRSKAMAAAGKSPGEGK